MTNRWTMVPDVQFRENLRLATDPALRSVPGNVTECGTWRGGMLAAIAAATGRRAVGLDSFEGLPPAERIDGPVARAWQNDVGGPTYHDNCRASVEDFHAAMAAAGVRDYAVHPGWMAETLPLLPVEPIAILRIDVDWFEATSLCLSRLYERVSPGGLVVMDDYAAWDGCAIALHRFLASRGSAERIMMDRQTWVCHFYKK